MKLINQPTWLLAGILLWVSGNGLLLAEGDARKPDQPSSSPPDGQAPTFDELTPEWRTSVDKGLAWLAKHQSPDGSFGASGSYHSHVGISALAGLAFLADGNLPQRGRYGAEVQKVLDYILSCSQGSGLLQGQDVDHGPMYGHGFATLFLAEVYGQSQDPAVKETLRKAVRLILSSQNDEGGWRYQPRPMDADISVTICQVMALRAARNAGIKVPKECIDRATQYVLKSQENDGGFRYMLNSAGSAFPRSAAGLATLYYAGMYQGKPIERALEYLRRFKPGQARANEEIGGYYYYGHYYAVQAMFLAGGKHWAAWWPAIRDTLIKKQLAGGNWEGEIGPEYCTATALIILQVPNRLLPILQR